MQSRDRDGDTLPFDAVLPIAPPGAAAPAGGLIGPSIIRTAMSAPVILVFDSGLGGLTVFREIARARPDAHFVYVADDLLFPYGDIEASRLVARVVELMTNLVADYRPDLVVIACNTASTLVLPVLRQRFSAPFVGTVPAIKPACALSVTKCVSVLGTQATVKREYTHALIRQYGSGCKVTLVGSSRLAGYAERELAGDPVADAALAEELAPCFVDDGARTDTVVLACTHFPLLTARFEQIAPWPVRWLDPAAAIARRVVELIGASTPSAVAATSRIIFTSGRPSPIQPSALTTFGFGGMSFVAQS
jgi:glutamate racemase